MQSHDIQQAQARVSAALKSLVTVTESNTKAIEELRQIIDDENAPLSPAVRNFLRPLFMFGSYALLADRFYRVAARAEEDAKLVQTMTNGMVH